MVRAAERIVALAAKLNEVEHALIPHGMHVVGRVPSAQARVDTLLAIAESTQGAAPAREASGETGSGSLGLNCAPANLGVARRNPGMLSPAARRIAT